MTDPTPHEALALALVAARRAGLVIPCRTDDAPLWTSDHATDRAEAARRCTDDACPALDACRAAAQGTRERWHVWAGTDHTDRTTHRATPRTDTQEEA